MFDFLFHLIIIGLQGFTIYLLMGGSAPSKLTKDVQDENENKEDLIRFNLLNKNKLYHELDSNFLSNVSNTDNLKIFLDKNHLFNDFDEHRKKLSNKGNEYFTESKNYINSNKDKFINSNKDEIISGSKENMDMLDSIKNKGDIGDRKISLPDDKEKKKLESREDSSESNGKKKLIDKKEDLKTSLIQGDLDVKISA